MKTKETIDDVRRFLTWGIIKPVKPKKVRNYELFADEVATHEGTKVIVEFCVDKRATANNGSGRIIFYEYVTRYHAKTDEGWIKYKEIYGGHLRKNDFKDANHRRGRNYAAVLAHIVTAEERLAILREAFPDMKIEGPLDKMSRPKQRRIKQAIRELDIKPIPQNYVYRSTSSLLARSPQHFGE